jgi:hypothetical protein
MEKAAELTSEDFSVEDAEVDAEPEPEIIETDDEE